MWISESSCVSSQMLPENEDRAPPTDKGTLSRCLENYFLELRREKRWVGNREGFQFMP